MPCRRLIFALAVAVLTPLAAGQSQPSTAPEARPDAVEALINDLSSTSYATREAAQKSLLAVPIDQIERVRALAARVTDPEATERLRTILKSLETIEVTTTPGVTLDVKNAPLADVAAALTKSAGVPIEADSEGSSARFTLAANDQPLWDVIDQLSHQHALSLADRDGLVLKPANAASSRHRQIVRGVLFSISDPQMGGFAGGVRPRAWPSNMDIVVAVDPRITLFQAHPPVFHSVRDNLGHDLPLPEEDEAAKQVLNDPARIWSREISLGAPMEIGDKINVAGSVTFSAILPQKPVEIADPVKHLREPIQVGTLKITLRQLLATAAIKTANGSANVRALGLKFDVVPESSGALPPDVGDMKQVGDEIHAPSYGKRSVFPVKGVGIGTFEMGNDDVTITDGVIRYDGAGTTAGMPGAPLEIVAVDATGRKIMSAQLTINSPCTAISAVQTDYQDPIKLVLRSGGIREATVPFDYKDLPLQH